MRKLCTGVPKKRSIRDKNAVECNILRVTYFPKRCLLKQNTISSAPSKIFLSCDYLCNFQQARPNHGY